MVARSYGQGARQHQLRLLRSVIIPISIPSLSGNERRYLNECIDTNFVSSVGPFVDRLENDLAEASGARWAVATASGTSGLHVALLSVGVGPGDLVVVPSYSFIASANAVAHCGAKPWLVDIDASSWTLDPTPLANLMEREVTIDKAGRAIHAPTGQRVAAIMPVHTLGLPADMDPILETARQLDVPVVADGAAALGAEYRGCGLGACGADLTIFSFNGNKTITAGGGGAIVGNDPYLEKRARHLSTTARVGPEYNHDEVGFNYRMTNLQAAVGCAQLERLTELVSAKRAVRERYVSAIAPIPGMEPFPSADWAKSAAWLSGFCLTPPDACRAGDIRVKLRDRNIDARTLWKPIHLQRPYLKCLRTTMSVAESTWESIVAMPSSANISEEDLAYVIATLSEIAGSSG